MLKNCLASLFFLPMLLTGCSNSPGSTGSGNASSQDYYAQTNAYNESFISSASIIGPMIPAGLMAKASYNWSTNITTNGLSGSAVMTPAISGTSNSSGISVSENLSSTYNNYFFDSGSKGVNGSFSVTINEISNISGVSITVASTASLTWNSVQVSWDLKQTGTANNISVTGTINGHPVNTNIVLLQISM